MEAILNRLAGTGYLFNLWFLNVNGKLLYGFYTGLLFGLLTQNVYIGVIGFTSFLLAKSLGYDKWVGNLIRDKPLILEDEYKDNEGKSFPYIHYIANFIIKEKEHFIMYCETALFIRGFVWGLILYLSLFIFNFISLFEYFILSFIYGVGFPLGCYLATLKSFNYKSRFISIMNKWELQEVYYGFIHMLCNSYLVWSILC